MRVLGWMSAATVAAVLGVVGLSACSGGSGGSTCRKNMDCTGSESCVGPDDGPSCGIPPQHGCMSSNDCTGSQVCNAVLDACSASGIGSTCGPPCTSTAACGMGLQCSAQKACEAIACDDGFHCPAYQRCDTVAAHAVVAVFDENHGCVSITCMADADCPPSTFCVNGTCESGPGSCQTVMAVP